MNYTEKMIKMAHEAKTRECKNLYHRVGCLNFDMIERDVIKLHNLNQDKMKAHILDCIAALSHVQWSVKYDEETTTKNDDVYILEKEKAENLQLIQNTVFLAAISILTQELIHGTDEQSSPVKELLCAFPDAKKMTDGRDWLCLHWAIAAGEAVDEKDVKVLYASDPVALKRPHQSITNHMQELFINCYTPVQLLCMQKQLSLPLVTFLMMHNPAAFTGSHLKYSPIHIAANNTESVAMLQTLLQGIPDASNQLRHGVTRTFHAPLGYLCRRKSFPNFPSMFSLLLEADSSVKVVLSSIRGVLQSSNGFSDERTRELLEVLLEANPEAALKGVYELTMTTLGPKCIGLLPLFLQRNDKVISCQVNGFYPFMTAMVYNTLHVADFLLTAFIRESKGVEDSSLKWLIADRIFHSTNPPILDKLEKVNYFFLRYPSIWTEQAPNGLSILHRLCRNITISDDWSKVVKDLHHRNVIVKEVQAATGRLPLHYLIRDTFLLHFHNPLSNASKLLRLLVRLYPASVGIEDTLGIKPCILAWDRGFPNHIIRIILRADSSIDHEEFCRLNYNERRLGLFLAFRAVVKSTQLTIWTRLRFQSNVLLRLVFSFL